MIHWILVSGALLGAAAVISGAFGAHALQGVLSVQARGWYDTAVTYHATHALALLACGLAAFHAESPDHLWFKLSAGCFLAGIVVFSGSLYAMAFTGITRLGMITPIGGVFLIVAWLSLAFAATKMNSGVLE